MYIKKTNYQNTDPVYTITELEVVEDYPTEIRDLFIEAFVEAQDIVKTIWVIDNVSEEEVEFDVEDYFTKEEIDGISCNGKDSSPGSYIHSCLSQSNFK